MDTNKKLNVMDICDHAADNIDTPWWAKAARAVVESQLPPTPVADIEETFDLWPDNMIPFSVDMIGRGHRYVWAIDEEVLDEALISLCNDLDSDGFLIDGPIAEENIVVIGEDSRKHGLLPRVHVWEYCAGTWGYHVAYLKHDKALREALRGLYRAADVVYIEVAE